MDQQVTEGIRLLSLDGGDLRAVSQLVVLDEFMRRVEWDKKSSERILPCDYFHMITGVGTGGIIIFLLCTLRMEVRDAIDEFIIIWETVFADASLDRVARSTKLESVLKNLLSRNGIEENRKLCFSEGEETTRKVFVCAAPETNLGSCEIFRNYVPKGITVTVNPSIVEAFLATCAIPTLFAPVRLDSTGCQISYVTGAYNFNNPIWQSIKEATQHFGKHHPVACILSLGCGLRGFPNTPQNITETEFQSFFTAIASDSETAHRELAARINKTGVYYRFSVELRDEAPPDLIFSCVDAYLQQPDTTERVDECVSVAGCFGRKSLGEIFSFNTEKPTAAAHGLPSLSASFVDRPNLIRKMSECLFRIGPSAQRRMVISGLGGIGKTQIVISFFLQFLSRFRHVLFIDGSSTQNLERGIVAKIKSLGAAYFHSDAMGALEVLANPDYEITRDWAIIYDNVDDPNINIGRYFPTCAFGTIVITTRNPNLGNLAPKAHLTLDVMSEEESIKALLLAAVDSSREPTEMERQNAREIAQVLGYLPVALVQAGYFIKLHDCMGTYEARLKSRRPDILSRPAQEQLDEHYHGVYATLNVTWPHLSARTQNFLSILGFVNYTGLPLILVYRASDHHFSFEPLDLMPRPDNFQQTVQLLCDTFRPREDWNQQDVDDLVAELERYSLITRIKVFTVTTLRIHPLVHSWIHDRLSQQEQETYRTAAVRLLVCGTGEDDEDIFEFIHPHTSSFSGRLERFHVNDRAGIARLLSHQGDCESSMQLWESIHRDVITKYGADSVRTSETKLHLARIYWKLVGKEYHAAAKAMESEAVELRKRVLGPDDDSTLQAIVQQAQGTFRYTPKAVVMLRNSLERWNTREGCSLESILRTREALGAALRMQISSRDRKEAVQICTEILRVRMERKGPEHCTTIKATEALARAYDRYAVRGAEATTAISATGNWISIVEARKKSRGIQHPDTLYAMENLATSYEIQGMYEPCMEQWKEVIRLRSRVQGPDHKATVGAIECLLAVRKPGCRNDRVERQQERVDIMRELQGVRHRDTLREMSKLAQIYAEMSLYSKSMAQSMEVIRLKEEVLGPIHPETHEAMSTLADLYVKWGRYDAAASQWLEIISKKQKTPGWTHLDTHNVMLELASRLESWGKYEEAEKQWTEVVILKKGTLGINHPNTLETMSALANFYHRRERYDEVEKQLLEIIAARKQSQGARHPDTLGAVAVLESLHANWGSFQGEEGRCVERIALMSRLHGPNHPETIDSLGVLAKFYATWKRYDQAKSQLEEVIARMRKALGRSHPETVLAILHLATSCDEWGWYADAEAYWRVWVNLTKEKLGRTDPKTIESISQFINRCIAKGRYDTAEEQWLEIIALKREAHGSYHENTLEAMEQYASMCKEKGTRDNAMKQWKEVIRIRRISQGPAHEDTIRAMWGLQSLYLESGQKEKSQALFQIIWALKKPKSEKKIRDLTSWKDEFQELLWEIKVSENDGASGSQEPKKPRDLMLWEDEPQELFCEIKVSENNESLNLMLHLPMDWGTIDIKECIFEEVLVLPPEDQKILQDNKATPPVTPPVTSPAMPQDANSSPIPLHQIHTRERARRKSIMERHTMPVSPLAGRTTGATHNFPTSGPDASPPRPLPSFLQLEPIKLSVVQRFIRENGIRPTLEGAKRLESLLAVERAKVKLRQSHTRLCQLLGTAEERQKIRDDVFDAREEEIPVIRFTPRETIESCDKRERAGNAAINEDATDPDYGAALKVLEWMNTSAILPSFPGPYARS